MKLTLILIAIALAGAATKAPEKGDYIMLRSPNDTTNVTYVFNKSSRVYYGFHPATQETDNKYKQSKKNVKELFDFAKSIDLLSMKGMDETKVDKGDGFFYQYRVVEYCYKDKVNSVCWNTMDTSEQNLKLNDLLMIANGLW